MPLYEMKCLDCSAESDHFFKLDEPNPSCPACGGRMEKQISVPKIAKVAAQTGPIHDMRQVKDSHGERWRETPGSHRPGGARKKEYF